MISELATSYRIDAGARASQKERLQGSMETRA